MTSRRSARDAAVRPMEPADARPLSAAFARIGWSKPVALFERYVRETADGDRTALVVLSNDRPVGYVTVRWRSGDPVLREAGVPEIEDLNVLPDFRARGLGSLLLDRAEALVGERHHAVGLRVGLHAGYGAAQRLYVARGYRPDGAGVVVDGRPVPEGATVTLDDEATLRMLKPLR